MQRLDKLGSDSEQDGALAQRLAHQVEFEIFQVTKATVNELRIFTAGSGCEMRLLDQTGAKGLACIAGAQSEIAQNAGAVDAPADDQNIDWLRLETFDLLAAEAGHSLDSLDQEGVKKLVAHEPFRTAGACATKYDRS